MALEPVSDPVRGATRLGFDVLRGIVPLEARETALRHIHRDILRHGLPDDRLGEWLWSAHWFPHLKWDAPIVGLLDHLPARLREGELCDPQILLHLPDEAEHVELESHVDQEPAWADGRRYRRIVGVALSPGRETNGGLVVWPLDGGEPVLVEVEPGDVVVLDPALPHTSGLNREGGIRYAVYFRFLEPAAAR